MLSRKGWCPFLALAVARLPLCLQRGERPVRSRLALAWYSLSPWFCGRAAVPQVRAFPGKILSAFFPLSLAVPQFCVLSHVSSLRLSSGRSGPVLTLSRAAHTSLFSPPLRVVDASIRATSLLGAEVRCIICGFYLFIPPGYVAPPEIPKLPTDQPVRGFPGVWKLLPIHDSLSGTGLHP